MRPIAFPASDPRPVVFSARTASLCNLASGIDTQAQIGPLKLAAPASQTRQKIEAVRVNRQAWLHIHIAIANFDATTNPRNPRSGLFNLDILLQCSLLHLVEIHPALIPRAHTLSGSRRR